VRTYSNHRLKKSGCAVRRGLCWKNVLCSEVRAYCKIKNKQASFILLFWEQNVFFARQVQVSLVDHVHFKVSSIYLRFLKKKKYLIR
jgi:hypothetical protein